jgi:hypothetical protein
LKKPPSWFLLGKSEGLAVRFDGFGRSPEPAAKVGVCGMGEIEVIQLATREDCFDESQA